MAPTDNPIIIKKVPIHLPKMKPAKTATGDPKPAAKTQIIVKRKNRRANKNIFDCLNSKK